ncbi:olfactory receptor 10W1-like [Cervus elaphus]|uniref:olfactory receptor 10W1-like n=1 Tax=Cervus elaphus TaxID=9860 RepID=UPI001CC319AE|nr:olfactory receptor 10W1-like [Cervus elaphus]
MSWGNRSVWLEFVFLAYPSKPEPRALAFLGASLVYTWVITGNVLIMVAIQTKACLHTPMHYFLGSLSGVEIGYTAAVVPHLPANALRAEKTITLLGCATQMGFFIRLGGADCLLLASVAMNAPRWHEKESEWKPAHIRAPLFA